MDVSIIIVSWNVEDYIVACLQSIFESVQSFDNNLSIEVIIVDSASTDKSVAIIESAYPQVTLLPQDENVGFTRANNIGLAAATGRYLYVLNPDTEIIDDSIQKMVAYMDANPQVGIVGPHTLNTDGSIQSSRRRFPTRLLAFFESTWLQPMTPKSMLDHYYMADTSDNDILDVDWVQGSAMLVRREVYEQVGGFDTDYVMYSEELDWCHRAKDAGWQVTYLGTAQIIHHGGKSSEQAGAWKHIHFQKSKIHYYEKFHGRTFATLLRVFLKLNYIWQITIEGLKSALGHKRSMRQERIKIYLEVLRSGL